EKAVPRISDLYAAQSAMTGKLELEYEGEQQGAGRVVRDLIKSAVGAVFDGYFGHLDCSRIVSFFNDGGALRLSDMDSSELCLQLFARVGGWLEVAPQPGWADSGDPAATVSTCELILEGLYARKKITRTEERGYTAAKQEPREYGFESLNRSRRVN